MLSQLKKSIFTSRKDIFGSGVRSSGVSIIQAENIVLQSGNYTVEGFFYSRNRLVITFEPDTDKKPGTELRPGWGSVALRKNRISHLCVKPSVSDWYQGSELADIFRELKEHISLHSRIITYGASMGGFGALAYADLLGANEVYAFDPQSTLHRPDVPWEKRFIKALPLDFTGPFGSSVGKFSNADQVYIFLDWHTSADRMHAERLRSGNVEYVNIPYTGHGAAYAASAAGVMKHIMHGVMYGDLDRQRIYRDLHLGRRKVDRYALEMKKRLSARPKYKEVIDRYFP